MWIGTGDASDVPIQIQLSLEVQGVKLNFYMEVFVSPFKVQPLISATVGPKYLEMGLLYNT